VIEHPAAPAAMTLVLMAVASAEAIAAVKRIAGEPALPMFAVFVVVMTHSALVSIKAGAGSLRVNAI
jgi:hypothetical protein